MQCNRPSLMQIVLVLLSVTWMIASVPSLGDGKVLAQSAPRLLAGTEELRDQGDIASNLVDVADRYLLQRIERSVSERLTFWQQIPKEKNQQSETLEALRNTLRSQIGLVDPLAKTMGLQVVARMESTSGRPIADYSFSHGNVYGASWRVFDDVDGEGLMVIPNVPPRFVCVCIPDAGQTPDDLCGIGSDAVPDSAVRTGEVNSHLPIALEIAARGGLVVVPSVVSRTREQRNRNATMTDQEFIYRAAFVLGRHLLGYEVGQVQAAVNAIESNENWKSLPMLLCGWGEGGWIALHVAAIDERFQASLVSGHFGPRESVWREPIHRNIQGLLKSFGDAELAALGRSKNLVIDPKHGPTVDLPSEGGAPGQLIGPDTKSAKQEFERAQQLVEGRVGMPNLHWIELEDEMSQRPSSKAVLKSIELLGLKEVPLKESLRSDSDLKNESKSPSDSRSISVPFSQSEIEARRQRWRTDTLSKWDRHQQRLLEGAAAERQPMWDSLQKATAENYEHAVAPMRNKFRSETIGDWNETLLPPQAATRLLEEKPTWVAYEVKMPVFGELFTYGVLVLPRDGKPLVGRPCVVFQHGLEGRPTDTLVGDHPAYHDVSAKLAEQGYIVFSPQNLYLFRDRFRTLQRKSNPMGRTLFSLMVPQHQQIVNWLSARPEVDPKRIAFYGLSYGGKSAMRIPALVNGYCLSICSADFNDWVWKNASSVSRYSYVWTLEYEIFEFGLGRSFNYAEMAALIAPRPFMVERGHHDGVAPDERVGLEFAKVNRLYRTVLKQPDHCRIEWFDGPHTIHGKGTFEFLAKHLADQ
jgi:dienelactone hydrolase